jgi:hypothetical protein
VFAQQDALIDLDGGSARVSRGTPDRPLTGRSADAPGRILSAFLRGRHDDETLRDLLITRAGDQSGGAQHIAFGQRIDGLDVYGTYVRASLTPNGELLSVIENLVSARSARRPARIEPAQALAAVLARYYPGLTATLREARNADNTVTYESGGPFDQAPTVTRVAVPLRGNVLDTGYLVVTWDRANMLRHTVVSGGGEIVAEELRTNFDQYNIFPVSPSVGGQQLITAPADPAASPAGWLNADGNTTIGNNTDAYLDRDNNNVADTNGRPVVSGGIFNFAFDTATAATTTTNQMAAVTNLFYLNNLLHDRLYKYGFDETAGNFQMSNFGNGGAENDPVNAEAQDGGGTSNANFATPNDGSRPRMQMYLWNTATPSRDGDVDSDIVYHEYGHGLTWRMIGNMQGPFSGAIGEGMSDVLAIYFNNDDAVAEYSANNANGIRRNRYTNYPRTYGDITGSSVHNDGEIYAATMWRVRQNWLAHGRQEEQLRRDIVNGMNFTPSRPQNEDMREGILAAMNARSASTGEKCDVWEAFAHFGVGVGANGVESCFIFCSISSITESFAVPSECTGGGSNTAPVVIISSPSNNASFAQGTSVTFTGTADDDQQGSLTAGLIWKDGPTQIGTGGSFSVSNLAVGSHTMTASVTDSGGLTGSASVTISITQASGITLTFAKRKVKGVNVVDLAWSGASSVDVYRNTAKIASSVGGATYTDNTGTKGGQTFTYKVCNAGSTTTCSNTVTVAF